MITRFELELKPYDIEQVVIEAMVSEVIIVMLKELDYMEEQMLKEVLISPSPNHVQGPWAYS